MEVVSIHMYFLFILLKIYIYIGLEINIYCFAVIIQRRGKLLMSTGSSKESSVTSVCCRIAHCRRSLSVP